MNSHKTIDLTDHKAELDEVGYCLIEESLSKSEVAAFKDHLNGAAAGGTGVVMNLIGYSRDFLDLALHPIALELSDHLLGPEFLLWGINAMIKPPQSPGQGMHVTQAGLPPPWTYPSLIGMVYFLDDMTTENGGVTVRPGSHNVEVHSTRGIRTMDQWLDALEFAAPLRDEITITGPAGSMLVMDGRLWHQAGANNTDCRWHAPQVNFSRPFLRHQTNYFLSLKAEMLDEIKSTPLLRRLFGYDLYAVVMGWIDPPR